MSQPEDGVCVPEAHVVMQMTADDIITLIHSYIQVGGAAAALPYFNYINRVTEVTALKKK